MEDQVILVVEISVIKSIGSIIQVQLIIKLLIMSIFKISLEESFNFGHQMHQVQVCLFILMHLLKIMKVLTNFRLIHHLAYQIHFIKEDIVNFLTFKQDNVLLKKLMLNLMILIIIYEQVLKSISYLIIHSHKLHNAILCLGILLCYQIILIYRARYNLLIL